MTNTNVSDNEDHSASLRVGSYWSKERSLATFRAVLEKYPHDAWRIISEIGAAAHGERIAVRKRTNGMTKADH